jgi:hypothetical protein
VVDYLESTGPDFKPQSHKKKKAYLNIYDARKLCSSMVEHLPSMCESRSTKKIERDININTDIQI